MGAGLGFTGDARQKFQLAHTAEQRLNQRLHRHQNTVVRLRVAPGFQVMRRRQVPVGLRKRFVLVIAQPHHGFGLALRGRPGQIRRRVVNRIAAQNHQRLHRTRVQQLRQIANTAGD